MRDDVLTHEIEGAVVHPLVAKLNVGSADPVFVVNVPPQLDDLVAALEADRDVRRSLVDAKDAGFVLGFATTQAEVDAIAERVGVGTTGDAVVWIAYPKATSKNYVCEFNRDTGWHSMGVAGFEPVRQVALDDDWSALRFRRAAFIRNWTRSFAYSEEGKRRLAERREAEGSASG
ncbi:hypothetical protein ABXJ56_09045 [Microbacterium chocolatum]|uniref:hypothetical protein n=1 Tax=Microbacterium aurantiacum TaxID=162393 RepID=UPI00338F9AB7